LQRAQLKARTLTLKIKYHDFTQITRNRSWPVPIDDWDSMVQAAQQLLSFTDTSNVKVRLLGISLSNFGEAPARNRRGHNPLQMELF
ncbi:MAG: DNA polymerase IV, partial [Chitinophagia bacterium]|nr:DNA polymerase IV [Chitinophagia bacterium]